MNLKSTNHIIPKLRCGFENYYFNYLLLFSKAILVII